MPANADVELAALQADHEFFVKQGLLPTAWNEIRRFPRFYLRGNAEALVDPPREATGDPSELLAILTCDVSRGGIGIHCPRQLFPEQRLEIRLPTGASYWVKVVWCRRLDVGRYAAGCVFVE